MSISIYKKRRAAVARALKAAGGGVALLPTAPELPRNRDSDFPYRHDSYFYYLTGFDEPQGWLAIDHHGRTALFCRPKDLEREIWDGFRMGPKAAPAALGVDAAFSVAQLDSKMPQLLENQPAVWFPFATHDGLLAQVDGWLGKVRARVRMGAACPESLHDLCGILDEMRMFKDSHEVAILRRAGKISACAHVRAMQTSAAMLRDGIQGGPREYHLEAELLHEFRRHGSQYPAYTSIVAAGANACVLHYRAGNAELKAGELCLIDAGCELDGYASDITRTFPADGKFTPAQRTLYDIVLAAQDAAVKVTRPGKRFTDPHDAATRVLVEGMLETGLLAKDKHGKVDDVLASGAYRQFYMHRTGHWMGMDVHDCGDYSEPGTKARQESDAQGQPVMRKPSRILRPGMVTTIEPGLYVRPAKGVPKEFWNIGIRIEDDALITPKGCELLTRGVPVKADDIEALMKG
ncbi:MAG: aminopeptidase P N-terminal domain-containing protein [Gammaproteobacteria bacterium]|nr:aminopeptidase P N-terminal domain-containing protein [Gammaproteobacteria bacterium]MBU0787257.1 aminopeptidase P N-terminal domain-containing protein [Gammaproteobacteria bacterium]MBU0815997.1 aminopeptidase P N-terminal domain-containing protein [Gammaproteobacteria bacterium]MBU1787536.1 aminopeptidase P N-terminal domain-containing protein [Gammaproteobacteria bacterium]